MDNANGNAGPYTADGRRIVFTQWVQIHVRRGRWATASAVAPGAPVKPLITFGYSGFETQPQLRFLVLTAQALLLPQCAC